MREHNVVPAESGKRVVKIKVRLVGERFAGVVRITDIMLQGGTLSTEWNGHPSETKWVI